MSSLVWWSEISGIKNFSSVTIASCGNIPTEITKLEELTDVERLGMAEFLLEARSYESTALWEGWWFHIYTPEILILASILDLRGLVWGPGLWWECEAFGMTIIYTTLFSPELGGSWATAKYMFTCSTYAYVKQSGQYSNQPQLRNTSIRLEVNGVHPQLQASINDPSDERRMETRIIYLFTGMLPPPRCWLITTFAK